MKIIFDRDDDSAEEHARQMHRKMLRKHKLPRIPGATRALEPGWCDICFDNRAWGPVVGGRAVCPECRSKDDKPLGFSS